MTHILDKININEIGEEWIYPDGTLIRIRRIGNMLEFAQLGYHDVDEFYRE